MELKNLPLPELKKLAARVQSEISKRQGEAKRNLLKHVEKLAAEHGLKLSDIIKIEQPQKAKPQKAASAKATGKLPIKYWNPLNPKEGWSGHARQPNWVVNWIGNGGKLEELTTKRV